MQYSILVIRKEGDGRVRPEITTCENKRVLKKNVKEAGLRPHRDILLAKEGAWESLQGELVFISPKEFVKPKISYGV